MKLSIKIEPYDDHRYGQPLAAVVRPSGLTYGTWKGGPESGGILTLLAEPGDVVRRWQPDYQEGQEGTKYFLFGPGGALIALTQEEAMRKIHAVG